MIISFFFFLGKRKILLVYWGSYPLLFKGVVTTPKYKIYLLIFIITCMRCEDLMKKDYSPYIYLLLVYYCCYGVDIGLVLVLVLLFFLSLLRGKVMTLPLYWWYSSFCYNIIIGGTTLRGVWFCSR